MKNEQGEPCLLFLADVTIQFKMLILLVVVGPAPWVLSSKGYLETSRAFLKKLPAMLATP